MESISEKALANDENPPLAAVLLMADAFVCRGFTLREPFVG